MLSAVVTMSILLQGLLGWNLKVFCLSLLINTLVVVITWRYRALVAVTPTQNPRSGIYSFIARVVFWLFLAVILFFGSKRFQ
jgi:hypothetical protein